MDGLKEDAGAAVALAERAALMGNAIGKWQRPCQRCEPEGERKRIGSGRAVRSVPDRRSELRQLR